MFFIWVAFAIKNKYIHLDILDAHYFLSCKTIIIKIIHRDLLPYTSFGCTYASRQGCVDMTNKKVALQIVSGHSSISEWYFKYLSCKDLGGCFQVFTVYRIIDISSLQGLCISYHFRSLRFISKPAIRYHYKAITNKEAVLHLTVSRNLNKKSCKNWSKRRMNSINRNLANHRAH